MCPKVVVRTLSKMCLLGQKAAFFPQIEGFMPLYLYSTALIFCNY